MIHSLKKHTSAIEAQEKSVEKNYFMIQERLRHLLLQFIIFDLLDHTLSFAILLFIKLRL